MPLPPIVRPKLARVGRPSGKFTQHRRIDRLRALLEAHAAGLTLEQLAEMLRMTTRSVRRYLRELALVTELESVEMRPGGAHLWRIKPSERGRAVPLRRTQAYGLLAARRVFEVLRGSALFDEIDLAHRLIEQVARRPAVRPGGRADPGDDVRLEDRFTFVPVGTRSYVQRSDDIDAAFQAVAERSVLLFRYRDDAGETKRGHSDKGARITAHVYAVVLHGGTIVCIARDVDRGEMRAFALDRMSELVVSDTARFEVPSDFDLSEWVQGDFGVANASRTVRLLVEFDARVGDLVRGRRVHRSQKLAVAADGRVRASFSVPAAPEVLAQMRSWILGFGAAVRVLEPPELAEDIAQELRRAVGRYG